MPTNPGNSNSRDDDAQKNCPNDILHRWLHVFPQILQIPCFWKCVCMFLQCFPSKHGNLRICRHKTVPRHHVLQCFQFPYLQTLKNTAVDTVFFNFSMFQCRWPTQTYVQKILQNHCFFCNVFTMFSVLKHRHWNVFRHKVGPKHWFLQCFSMLWQPRTLQFPYLPKPLKTPLFTLFSSIFSCSNAADQPKHIYKNPSKTLFFLQCFYNVFRHKTPSFTRFSA